MRRCLGSNSSVCKEDCEGLFSNNRFAFSHFLKRSWFWIYCFISSLRSVITGTTSYLYTEDFLRPSFKSFKNWPSYKFVSSKSARIDSILSFLKGLNLTGFFWTLSNKLALSSLVKLLMTSKSGCLSRLVDSFPLNYFPYCSGNDLQVKSERPVVYIPNIQFELLRG